MVPIYHTSAQILRYANIAIISEYLNIFKSLLGVTGPLIQNVCAEFEINFSQIFLLFYLYIQEI